MPALSANGITIEYSRFGNPDHPALLLIMGLGRQMTAWPQEFIDALLAHQLQVVIFDNRDIGLSSKFDETGVPRIGMVMLKSLLGFTPRTAYSLKDMADDAAALLDQLGISRAHVAGASMGGMIAQLMAIHHPDRVQSLISVMSSTGNRRLPRAKPEAMAVLTKRPASTDPEALLDFAVQAAKAIGSPGYPQSEERVRQRARADLERSYSPNGYVRQLAAIVADGDRRSRLANITAPTLVIHGEDDALVPVEAGKDTAAHIPGAELMLIPGMGHDLPLGLVDVLADAIAGFAQRHS